jgi:hypothetical protein
MGPQSKISKQRIEHRMNKIKTPPPHIYTVWNRRILPKHTSCYRTTSEHKFNKIRAKRLDDKTKQ